MNNNIRVQRSKTFLNLALTVWADSGYDTQYGGYVEALDFRGQALYDLDKRFRIHPRNIFAHSAGTVWGYYDGVNVAEKAFNHIIQTYWLKDQHGFATLSSRQGNILDSKRLSYDHSFVLLGFGWLYHATKNPLHKEWLFKTWDFLQGNLINKDGSFISSINSDGSYDHRSPLFLDPVRLQNPHMHMLEAILNLIELFDEDLWKDQAVILYELLTKHFANNKEQRLREFFNENWTPHKKMGNVLEPGHHYEWVWILQKYESVMNTRVPLIEPFYNFAIMGSNTHGLGYDQTDFNAKPIKPTHRMWIQTEVIKANVAMYKRSKNSLFIERANQALDILFQYYLLPEYGVWYDQLDDEMQNISSNAPTSTLYHVIIALNEYIQCIESIT